MNVEIIIDEQCAEARLVIYTREITAEINELVKWFSDAQPLYLIGYKDDRLEILPPEALIRIYADQQKVFAQADHGIFSLRQRLYEIEDKLYQAHFVRISNSEIVNFKKVKNLDISLAGTICLYFQNGVKTFVSRRYVAKIKTYLGI